jgi:uncharacterized protein YbjT (DUF2867 family)
MKILIAGAAGYLGTHLVAAALEAGHDVSALDLRDTVPEPLKHRLKRFSAADVTKPETLKGLLDGMDVVISSIGLELPRKNLSYWDLDYLGNLNLLSAAKQAGIKHFMYVSVMKADSDNSVPILKAKARFEKELKSSGLNYTIIRPTGYFKDFSGIFMKMAGQGRINLVGNGKRRINPVHPQDVAEFMIGKLGETESQTYDAGGPNLYSYDELARLCFRCTGGNENIHHVPAPVFGLLRLVMRFAKPLLYPVLKFSLWTMTTELAAPSVGNHKLEDYLREYCETRKDSK